MLTKSQKAAVLELNNSRGYSMSEDSALSLAESVRKAASEKKTTAYTRVSNEFPVPECRELYLSLLCTKASW